MLASTYLQRLLGLIITLPILFLGQAGVAAEIWTDTDWSATNWASIDSLDADTAPGELVLRADSLSFVPAFDATDYDGIWTMAVWRDQLYLGAGQDPPMMEDGADILIYDYENDVCVLDYETWEQGIAVLKVHDDTLYSPGIDSQSSSHAWGNIYYNDGSGWVRKETVPSAAHVLDMTFHDHKLWVSTGNGLPDMRGVLYSSSDMGDTWDEVFALNPFPPTVLHRRIYAITEFNGSIFVQPDFELPEEHMLYELKPDSTIVEHDILGYWEQTLAGFQEYRGQLVCLLPHAINIFDGVTWVSHSVPTGSQDYVARAITVFHDRLYIGGNDAIFATEDAVNWTSTSIVDGTGRVFEALTTFHGRMYAGSHPNGEVYVMEAPPGGTLVSKPHNFGALVAAGNLSWQAMTPGTETTIKFQLRSANDLNGLQLASFVGPDGSAASWYVNSGTTIATAHHGHAWFQYRVRLETTNPRLAPVLQEVQLNVLDMTSANQDFPAHPSLRAWPNPFNPQTTLHFDLPTTGEVVLAVYDVQGHLVKTLVRETLVAGNYSHTWNGTDVQDCSLAGGLYFARLSFAGTVDTQRLVLIK